MSHDREHDDQDDDDDDITKEHDFLASLIEKLKCEIDDSKNCNKLLESSNKTLVDKLKDLKKFQAKLDRYHDVNYASEVEINCAKAKGDLTSYKMKSQKSLNEHTRKINDLNQMILKMKKNLFAHQETISIISQEKEAQKKFPKTHEDKEHEKVIAFKNKIKVFDDIVYKTGQSVQTMNMLNRKCKTSFVKPEFLKKAQRPSPRLYDIGVIPTTSVSRPQLKSNRLEDRVMHNNSQGKTQQVEDHRRNFKFSNNKTSVTACNNSLNAKTSNVNFIFVTCGKCVLNDNHDMCVLHYINGVNSRIKMPMVVPIRTREPKRTVNQSVATALKRTIAAESTKDPHCPIIHSLLILLQLVEIILFIVDSGCSKHMIGNLKLLSNFVEKFLGTVKFGNDQISPILSYRDLVQGNVTIKRVCYVERLNQNLLFVGQFCEADLEVAFSKSTCCIRDSKGNDLLTGSRGVDLYSITLQDTSTPNLICLMAKASSSQAWLWHLRLSYLNFGTINMLSKYDILTGLPKLKFVSTLFFL
uniref:Integrase, catalytic region, zinc finger, CCHC-type, peptidase aspartic, catalytic n=1 Tax=Tanacetum cinerariifolium TaxID=118510 RepID=A0A6L2LLV7_TANCI|nr:integrase, catalytic region, zinc finger, CCHC-type, peptidase aspartic, catalytic [Tanacetum cinerariifolium]